MSAVPEKPLIERDADWTLQQPPVRGVLSLLPSSWVPYAELTRIHKPVGVVVIYLPYLLGAFFGAITTSTPSSPKVMVLTSTKLLAASFILRSAGCTWNDVVDGELDRQVSRTRLRPVARGAVAPRNGIIFFCVQICLWLVAMGATCPRSLYTAAPVIPLVLCYPYAKRVTDYPQLTLGITLAWGIFPGNATLGHDLAHLWHDSTVVAMGLWSFFVAYVIWTLIYDTIYGFQDIEDDMVSGIRSMAIVWRQKAKTLLIILATLQCVTLIGTGWSIGAGVEYYVFSCGGSSIALALMTWRVDLQDPKACGWWFQYGILMVGSCLTAGMAGTWLRRICST